MKTYTQILLTVLALAVTTQLSSAANIIWTNTAGGNWSATNNWSPNQTPGSGDIAIITNDASYAVTLDANLPVGGIVLGTAGGVNTQIFLLNGQTLTLNGTAVIGASGMFTMANNDVLGGNVVLNGAMTCSGGTVSGALTVASNSMLTASSPGMILDSIFGGSVMLTNYGTVNWSSGTIYNDYSPQIDNYGLWNAQSDDTFSGREISGNAIFNNYGTFRKSAGSGTTTVDANTVFNTSGTVDVQTGTVLVEGGSGSGVLNVAGSASASFDTRFLFIGGTLFTGAGSVTGYLIGSNAVFSGTLNCSGDTLSGTLTLASNSVLNLGALTVVFDTYFAGSGILTNYGTVNLGAGNLACNNSPVIDNYGLWNAQTDNVLAGNNPYGTTTFNNYATFRKSAGSGTATVDANTVFNTSGTVDVQTGTVLVEGGSGSGVLNVAGSASASFDTRFLFIGGTLFTGAGSVTGYLIGSNAVFSGTLNCSGDTLSGTLTLASNSVLNLGASALAFNSVYAGVGILTNYGTMNWGAGNITCDNSPVIDNYGLWNSQADSSLFGRQSSGNTVINNFGTIRKSAGSGTTSFASNTLFTNTGTVDVQTGTFGLVGSFSLTDGTLNFGINNSNNFGSISISGNAVLGGTMSVNLNNLYAPRANSSFAVLSYNSRIGAFANYNLPAGLVWTNNYGNTVFSLLVTSVVPVQLSEAATKQNGTIFSFTFVAVPGQIYQIQYTTNLAPANWLNLDGPINATTNTVTVSDTIQNSQLFYRAVLQ